MSNPREPNNEPAREPNTDAVREPNTKEADRDAEPAIQSPEPREPNTKTS